MEVDINSAVMACSRTKSFKFIPEFSYKKLEEHLLLDGGKTPDRKPVGQFKHKKVDINYTKRVIQGSLK